MIIATLVGILSLGALALSTAGGPSPALSPTPSPQPSAVLSSSEVEGLLNDSLQARIAGAGAEEYGLYPSEVPLLYATSSGDRYEQAEFEQVLGKEWPGGYSAYMTRLSAGDTVVEQLFFWRAEGPPVLHYAADGYATEIPPTTENGRPVASRYQYFNGAVSLDAAHPWVMYDRGIPFGRLVPDGSGVPPTSDGGQRMDWDHIVLMADPPWVGTGCESGQQPGDAEAHAASLAESIRSDPGLEATSPVPVSIGGYDGLMMDVRIAAGADVCAHVNAGADFDARSGVLSPIFDRTWQSVHHEIPSGYVVTGSATGDWLRLYLADVRATSGMQWLAIAIVAPESDFERAVAQAAPLIDSIEVRP